MTRGRFEVDVAVVGAGAAGVMAAIAAADGGARVALVAGPPGATALSSGAVDLAEAPEGPLARISRETLDRLSSTAAGLLSSDDGPYGERPEGARPAAVTSLGAVRSSWLLQRSQADLHRLSEGAVVVADVGPARRFSAVTVARGLAGREDVATRVVELPRPAELDLGHPLLAAKRLDGDEELQRRLGEAIASAVDESEVGAVLLPPILGLDRSAEVTRRVSEGAGAPVREVLGSPGDPSGLRLARRLAALVEGSEARRLRAKVVSVEPSAEGADHTLHLEGPEEVTSVTAKIVVLATGGLAGGGLVLSEHLGEPLLGLPLSGLDLPVPASAHGVDPKAFFSLDPAGPHPVQRAGVETDSELRPPGLANVLCAGALLAGADPSVSGSGLGTALVTGLLAGETAAQSLP